MTELLLGSTPTAALPNSAANPLEAEFNRSWEERQNAIAQAQAKKREDAVNSMDSALLDWDNFSKGMPVDINFAEDPETARKRGLVNTYLTIENNGQEIGGGDLGPQMMRDQIAMDRFNGRGVGDDMAFYGEIEKEARGRKDTRELSAEMQVAASGYELTSAAGSEGKQLADFDGWIEQAKSKPGFNPNKLADYREQWNVKREAIRELSEPFMPELKTVWQAFQKGEDAGSAAASAYYATTPEERPQLMDALAIMGKALPKEEQASFWQNLKKSTGRGVSGMGNSIVRSLVQNFQDEVDSSIPITDAQKEAKQGISGAVKDVSKGMDFVDDVIRVQQQSYDPIKKLNDGFLGAVEGGIYGAPSAISTTVLAMTPVAGQYLTYQMMKGSAYSSVRGDLISRGMNPDKAAEFADSWATPIAAIQYIPERIGFETITRNLPIFNKTVTRLSDGIRNRALRGLTATAATGAVELSTEMAQDLVPGFVQEVAGALQQDVPDVVWSNGKDGVFDDYGFKTIETAVAILPLAIFGAAGGLNREARARAFAEATPAQRSAFGITAEANSNIDAAAARGQASLNAAIDEAMASRDPNSETSKAAVVALEAEQKAQEENAKLAVDSGVFPVIRQNAEGWTVTDRDTGTEYGPVPTPGDAMRLAQANFSAVQDANAEQVGYMASMLEGVALTSANDKGKTDTSLDLGQAMTATIMAASSPEAASRVRQQLEVMEKAGEIDGDFAGLVFGSSQTDFEQGQRKTLNKLFSGSSIATVFHEAWHGYSAEALATGRMTRDEQLDFAIGMNDLFAAANNRRGQKILLFPEGTTRENVTDTMLDEAISKIAEAEVLKSRQGGRGREGDGRKNVQGITSGMVTRNMKTLIARKMRSAKKFSAMFEAVRGYFGVAMSRAIIMRKAERDGKLDPKKYEAFVSKLTGLSEQDSFDADATKAAREITGNPSFSIGEDIIDPLISNAAKKVKPPKAREKIFGDIITRLQKLNNLVESRGVAFNFDAFGKPFEGEFSEEKTGILNALAVLDGILAAVPPDLRGRIGGYTQLAKLDTDAKRLDYLKRRLKTVDRVINDWLKKEYGELLDDLTKKAKPKGGSGEKARGTLGAEAHRYFKKVGEAMALSEEDAKAQIKKIDEELANATADTDLDDIIDLSEDWQILQNFSNWGDKTAQEMADAVSRAQEVYDTGRNNWRVTEEARLEESKKRAQTAIKEAGGGKLSGVQARKEIEKRIGNSLFDGKWSLRSFREVLDLMFGEGSQTSEYFGNAARRAFTARTKAMIGVQRNWSKAMAEATGKKGRDARRMVYEMATDYTITAPVTESRTEKIKVPIATFFDAESQNTLGLSQLEIDQLTEQFEALPDKSRKKYLTLERSTSSPTEIVKFTEAEAVHLSMLWAQDQYKETMRKHGYGDDFQASIEESMSDGAKGLRQWLSDYYRENFEPMRKLYAQMYGVDLAQIGNYAPGTFYSMGTAETQIDPTSGVASGGDFKQQFLKQRAKHTAAPRAENAFDVFFSHANQTEHWKAIAPLSREIHGVFGNPDLKIALQAKTKAGSSAVSEWVKAIDANGVAMRPPSKLMQHLLTSQAYIALAWKASTFFKNAIGATINAAYQMPAGEYLRGMSRLMSGKIAFGEVWASDVIQNRLAGGFSPEMRAAISQAMFSKPSLIGDALLAGMEIHGKADAFGTAIGAAIAYDYHLRENLRNGYPESEAKRLAADAAADVVSRTAQPAEVIDRSLYELNLGTVGKLMFLFASEARQKSSMWATAWGNTLTGKPTAKDVRVLILSHLVVQPLIFAAGAAIKDALSPDDDEIWDEKNWNPRSALMAAILGPAAGIPMVRDLESILKGYGSSSPLGTYVNAGRSLIDILSEDAIGDESEWYEKKILNVLRGLSAATGVGSNVYQQAAGAIRNIAE